MKGQDSARKGTAVEYLVAATCILTSRLKLNASTSLVGSTLILSTPLRRDRTSTVGSRPRWGLYDFVVSNRWPPLPYFVFAAAFLAIAVEKALDGKSGAIWLVMSAIWLVGALLQVRRGRQD